MIEIRVFVDNVFSEGALDIFALAPHTLNLRFRCHALAYFQGGRVVMTLPAKPCATCQMFVSCNGSDVSLLSATVHRVNSIWVSPSDVLRAKRGDNGDSLLMAARIDNQQRGGDAALVIASLNS
jgi:hypothetical protein